MSNNKQIYFDNAATTKIYDESLDVMNDIELNYYSNPSSMHRLGFVAEQKLKQYTKEACDILNVSENEIIWTSGATESNNFALFQLAKKLNKKGRHIITTNIEHPSISKVIDKLENDGYQITRLSVDNNGLINLEELEKSITEETIFATIIYVNNEIGSIQNIEQINKILKQKNIILHVDATQGFMKIPFDIKKIGIDLMSVSAHKIHGPKGIGFLYIDKNLKLEPFLLGGGQQNNMRSGTINTPRICSFIKAIQISHQNMEFNYKKVYNLKKYLTDNINVLNNELKDISINCDIDKTSPYITSLTIKDIRSEVLLHSLEEDNIYVSAGSACSSNKNIVSNTLKSIGLKNSLIENTIRISFSEFNEIVEIDNFIYVLKNRIPLLRKFVRN